jgi:hypothetical protein
MRADAVDADPAEFAWRADSIVVAFSWWYPDQSWTRTPQPDPSN